VSVATLGGSHAAAQTRAQATARRVHGAPADEAGEPAYAGFVTRVIAFAIDAAVINLVAVLVAVVVALVFSVLPESHERDKLVVAIGGIAFVLWSIGYFVAFWTTTGQTPGNRAMQIRVERAEGSRLRPRHALLRLVGIVLSLPLFVGFIPILVTERRRGLPDWLAGTVVRVVPLAGTSPR
jgi:uncharacterized RDD family membrane protein YckC